MYIDKEGYCAKSLFIVQKSNRINPLYLIKLNYMVMYRRVYLLYFGDIY